MEIHHIPASDAVLVAHDVEVLIEKLRDLTNIFNTVYLLGRSIGITAVDDNGAALEKSLEERKSDLLVSYLVEVDLILTQSSTSQTIFFNLHI